MAVYAPGLGLRLFSKFVAHAISYGCEIWGSQCHGNLVSDAKKLQGVQLAILRNVCGHLPVGIPAAAIFAELAKDPCSFKWWVQLVGCALRASDLPQSSLHREILAGNVQDALGKPSSANWAAQVVKHIRSFGLSAPFAPDGTVLIDKSSFCRHAAGKCHGVWQGLHASPRSTPSKGAKLCTYHRWLARIGPVLEPYFQLPLSDRCMRRLFCFRLGAHTLHQMGRRLRMARVARLCNCPLCPGMHAGDERHYVFECPAFHDIRLGFQHLFDDSHAL